MENFSVLNWNAQGQINITGYTFFKKIQKFLAVHPYDIIVLQEMPERKLKNLVGLKDYHVAASENKMVLSKYPIANTEVLNFPTFNKKVKLGNSLKVDIKIGQKILRLYNCHFAIFRVGMATRLKQLEHIISDSQSHTGPTIICGDMNVTIPKVGLNRKIITLWHQEPKREMVSEGRYIKMDERERFNRLAEKHGFKEVLDLYAPTWSPFKSGLWELFKLKLDWFLVKNLSVDKANLGDYISDHRPIIVSCNI